MRRFLVPVLLFCSTFVFAQGATNNGLFFGIQGLVPSLHLGELGYANRIQEGKVLRFAATFGFTYDFFDSGSISQPNNYRFNVSLSADMIFVMTTTVINPYVGIGLSGTAATTYAISNGTLVKTYSIAAYVPFGFDYSISDVVKIGIETRVNLQYNHDEMFGDSFQAAFSGPTLYLSVWF